MNSELDTIAFQFVPDSLRVPGFHPGSGQYDEVFAVSADHPSTYLATESAETANQEIRCIFFKGGRGDWRRNGLSMVRSRTFDRRINLP